MSRAKLDETRRAQLLAMLAADYKAVPADQPWRAPSLAAGPRTVVLSARQRDVLDGICEGLTYEQIADRHYLSSDTIRTHAKRLFALMGARCQSHAAALACTGQVVVRVKETL